MVNRSTCRPVSSAYFISIPKFPITQSKKKKLSFCGFKSLNRRRRSSSMELWNRARSLAEEVAKRSQEVSLGSGASKLSGIIAETSKEIAAQASKRADQIIHLAEAAAAANPSPNPNPTQSDPIKDLDLLTFGITHDLREFIAGITLTTFRDFPIQDLFRNSEKREREERKGQVWEGKERMAFGRGKWENGRDDTELSDVPAVSNVRQDLSEWQEKHANLVLSTVKEISRLRYELCPRVMKERKFWRIYFILVNNHVAPYENRYLEDAKLKSSEQVKDQKMEPLEFELTSNQEVQEVKKVTKPSSTSTEQDLDAFLLGDTGDSDDDHEDGDGDLDDDLDKLVDSSDDEKEKS